MLTELNIDYLFKTPSAIKKSFFQRLYILFAESIRVLSKLNTIKSLSYLELMFILCQVWHRPIYCHPAQFGRCRKLFFSDLNRAKLYLLTLFDYFLSELWTIWPNRFLFAIDKCDVYAVDNFSILLISYTATENK